MSEAYAGIAVDVTLTPVPHVVFVEDFTPVPRAAVLLQLDDAAVCTWVDDAMLNGVDEITDAGGHHMAFVDIEVDTSELGDTPQSPGTV